MWGISGGAIYYCITVQYDLFLILSYITLQCELSLVLLFVTLQDELFLVLQFVVMQLIWAICGDDIY